jgi:LuxR family transcriptional regulator, maltose regulon positive regulatory protein
MPLLEHDALLAAKLDARAPGAGAIDRARLRALFDGAPDARLVLVAAPAGFGKTTALAAWLDVSGLRVAWLALDPRDDDPARFAHGLAAAAARAAGDPPPPRGDPSRPFDPELAVSVVLDLLAVAPDHGAGPRTVLVLDDYHVIGDPAIHGLVAELIERLPNGAALAIATRADPPIPLARLRARGELLEVRAADLRFTAAEAGELLRGAAADLDATEVATLTERTEGWAAVLRLAAISLRGRRDHAEVVRRFGATHRFVLDYVVEEVLAGLPPETQEFLLRTSILDRLTAPLCDAVTGLADGQERLEELERANLLIVPLDDERRWYRYHGLFAGVLRARLGMQHPDEVAALHGRAAAWHAEHGDDEEAIGHALDAGDLQAAVRLAGDASLRHLNAGELSTVRRWLDSLPDAAVRGDAQLSASYAWCIVLPGEAAGVAARVEDAERALGAGPSIDPVTEAAIRTQLALIRSRLADIVGDPAEAVAQARIARDLLPAGLPPEAEATLRGDATVLLARALFAVGDIDGAADAYAASLPDLRAGGNLFATGRAVADLARIAIDRGDPAAAVRLCEDEIALPSGRSSADASGAVWTALARARAELGQIGLAEVAAERGIEVGTRAGDAQVVRSARAARDRIRELSGAAGRPRLLAGPDGPFEALSPREVEVLRLVALGRSNAAIARELFVTVGTVKSHVHAISGKLGAANRVEAVARGRVLGIID